MRYSRHMTDYAIIQLAQTFQGVALPFLGMIVFAFTGLRGWRIWVKHRYRGGDRKEIDELRGRIYRLEKRLASSEPNGQIEERIRNLEDIVVSNEIKKPADEK